MSARDAEVVVEICLRCGAAMQWRHGTWQCPSCRLKIGCCEGETGDCRPTSS
jgi:rubrerythrin